MNEIKVMMSIKSVNYKPGIHEGEARYMIINYDDENNITNIYNNHTDEKIDITDCIIGFEYDPETSNNNNNPIYYFVLSGKIEKICNAKHDGLNKILNNIETVKKCGPQAFINLTKL